MDSDIRERLSDSRRRTDELNTFAGAVEQRASSMPCGCTCAAGWTLTRAHLVLGEDVHRLKGGTNGATEGLQDAYPDRVLGTPISENAFVGPGGRPVHDGRYKPVVEFMYPDFLWVAADQIFNQIGKARHMFGGTSPCPGAAHQGGNGSRLRLAAFHGPGGIFANCPGWRIVAPSTPRLRRADEHSVGAQGSGARLEHVDLYGTRGRPRRPRLPVPVGKAPCAGQAKALPS